MGSPPGTPFASYVKKKKCAAARSRNAPPPPPRPAPRRPVPPAPWRASACRRRLRGLRPSATHFRRGALGSAGMRAPRSWSARPRRRGGGGLGALMGAPAAAGRGASARGERWGAEILKMLPPGGQRADWDMALTLLQGGAAAAAAAEGGAGVKIDRGAVKIGPWPRVGDPDVLRRPRGEPGGDPKGSFRGGTHRKGRGGRGTGKERSVQSSSEGRGRPSRGRGRAAWYPGKCRRETVLRRGGACLWGFVRPNWDPAAPIGCNAKVPTCGDAGRDRRGECGSTWNWNDPPRYWNGPPGYRYGRGVGQGWGGGATIADGSGDRGGFSGTTSRHIEGPRCCPTYDVPAGY